MTTFAAKRTHPLMVSPRIYAGVCNLRWPDLPDVEVDIPGGPGQVLMTAFDPKRTFPVVEHRVGKAGAGFGTISGGDA